MRDSIFAWLRRNVPEGQILPTWLLITHIIFFPLRSFGYYMSRQEGYDWETGVWRIAGCKFSAISLRYMAKSQGNTYKITQANGVVTLELVQPIAPIASHDVTNEMLEAVRNLPMSMRNEHDIYATIVNSWIESHLK